MTATSPRTEAQSPRFLDLDLWDSQTILQTFWEGQLAAVSAVGPALQAIAAAADAAADRLRHGGRLFYIGAGTSGRLCAQDAAELAPTFDWPEDRAIVLLAGGDAALMRGVEDAEDDTAGAIAAVEAWAVGAGDVVIGLAASGTTPFALAGLRDAGRRGALTVAMANSPDRPLLDEAAHKIMLDTGPEVVAGSTRMKAGTAQRIALTLFSTVLMVRLGRVHGGLMVDMRATNAKLRGRALRMLETLSGCDDATLLRDALARTNGRIKPAVLVLRGLDPEAAGSLLAQSGDSLRAALAKLGG